MYSVRQEALRPIMTREKDANDTQSFAWGCLLFDYFRFLVSKNCLVVVFLVVFLYVLLADSTA